MGTERIDSPDRGTPVHSPVNQVASVTKVTRRRSGAPSSALQRKLEVGAANDPSEREADRVADEVVNRLASETRSAPTPGQPTTSRIAPNTLSASTTPTQAMPRQPTASRIARSIHQRPDMPQAEATQRPIGIVDDALDQRVGRVQGRGIPHTGEIRRSIDDAFGTDSGRLPTITKTTRPAIQREWRSELEADLGANVVTELVGKVHAGALKVLASKLPARTVRTVVRFFSSERIARDIVPLAQSYADHAVAIGLDDLNYLVDVALNDGWDSGSLPAVIAKAAQHGFGQWAHVLVHTAAPAGWTASQTAALIETGHTLGEELVTLAQKATPRNWTSTQLGQAIQAALAAGINNWDAMGTAISEPEVSSAELAESFTIQGRFAAGNARVKGRAAPANVSALCAPVVIPPAPQAAAPAVQVHFAEGDLAHYRSGHSYPDFALTRGNIRRAPQSTLFPPGTDVAARANASLAAAQPALTAAIQAGGTAAAPNANDEYANNNCMFYDPGDGTVRMDQCFPTVASGEARSKGTLLAVKAFVDP